MTIYTLTIHEVTLVIFLQTIFTIDDGDLSIMNMITGYFILPEPPQ